MEKDVVYILLCYLPSILAIIFIIIKKRKELKTKWLEMLFGTLFALIGIIYMVYLIIK